MVVGGAEATGEAPLGAVTASVVATGLAAERVVGEAAPAACGGPLPAVATGAGLATVGCAAVAPVGALGGLTLAGGVGAAAEQPLTATSSASVADRN